MDRRVRQPEKYPVDGREMTAQEIADMLGLTRQALWSRRSRLGGCSYQAIVNMFRAGQLGKSRENRYLIEGRWMTTGQIAGMLEIRPGTLSNWRWMNKGKSMEDAIAHFRQYQTGERQRRGGDRGGRPPSIQFTVGGRVYTVVQVAKRYGVAPQSVRSYLRRHNGDMAATLRHYRDREQEREKQKRQRAEAEIMKALGF